MKTSIDHLPEKKQQELRRLVDLILQCTQEQRSTRRTVRLGAFQANASDLRDPQLIILFGSHARGDWVDDKYTRDGNTFTYRSDFDVLVITPTAELARHLGVWQEVIERADRPLEGSTDTRSDYSWDIGEGPTPVTIIDHPLAYVNEQIRAHNYFFCDVRREGIVLHAAGDYRLAEPPKLDPIQRRNFAQKAYDKWIALAGEFFGHFDFASSRKQYNTAAFMLHQAAEHLYGAILLVFDGYKPKTHKIEELDKRASCADTEFLFVFPRQTEEEQRRFKLLCDAYVEARYEDSYSITREDLAYLAQRVEHLRMLTEHACQRRIRSYSNSE